MKKVRIKAKDLQKELDALGYTNFKVSKKEAVELLKVQKDSKNAKSSNLKLISINSVVSFFYVGDEQLVDGKLVDGKLVGGKLVAEKLVPSLKLLQTKDDLLKKIVVDMGAIKFVVNGADIMRPGIVSVDLKIFEGDFVSIVDEKHGKVIAVGKAMFSGEEIQRKKKGKVVLNLHYVGDEIWKI